MRNWGDEAGIPTANGATSLDPSAGSPPRWDHVRSQFWRYIYIYIAGPGTSIHRRKLERDEATICNYVAHGHLHAS